MQPRAHGQIGGPNECHKAQSVRSDSGRNRKGHILGEGSVQIDRTGLFEAAHHADVDQVSAAVLAARDVGLGLVIGDGHVQHGLPSLWALRGAQAQHTSSPSERRLKDDEHRFRVVVEVNNSRVANRRPSVNHAPLIVIYPGKRPTSVCRAIRAATPLR